MGGPKGAKLPNLSKIKFEFTTALLKPDNITGSPVVTIVYRCHSWVMLISAPEIDVLCPYILFLSEMPPRSLGL